MHYTTMRPSRTMNLGPLEDNVSVCGFIWLIISCQILIQRIEITCLNHIQVQDHTLPYNCLRLSGCDLRVPKDK